MIRNLLRKLLKREKPRASAPAPAPSEKLKGNLANDKDRPWYLDGQSDVEGWDNTDVKKG
ncbi:MAG: hypothetical protein ACOZNI_08785 [Myxococcota bacterium]